jgi:hypothetical protein
VSALVAHALAAIEERWACNQAAVGREVVEVMLLVRLEGQCNDNAIER